MAAQNEFTDAQLARMPEVEQVRRRLTELWIKWVKFSGLRGTHVAQGFFYSRFPEPPGGDAKVFSKIENRQLFYHRVDTPQSEDTLVFAMPEHPQRSFAGQVSSDGRSLVIGVAQPGRIGNSVYDVDLVDGTAPRLGGPVVKLVDDFGTTDTPEGCAYLRAYSPLHTVKPGAKYPAVLVATGDHDDRVFPAHSYKHTAAMQAAAAPESGPILIHIESNAGHSGSSGTSPVSKTIADWALRMGFGAHFAGWGK